MTVLALDIALVRAVFPDWCIVANGQAWQASRRRPEAMTAAVDRFAALGRPEIIASTPADLAVQLAALEYSLGITPTS